MRILAALFVSVIWTSEAFATCNRGESNVRDTRETIERIMEYGACKVAEQKSRIGNWLCHVQAGVGLQDLPSGRKHVLTESPLTPKFTVKISEVNRTAKRMFCTEQAFGTVHNYGVHFDQSANPCLANFIIETSPVVIERIASDETFAFSNPARSFKLDNEGHFTLVNHTIFEILVSQGRCQKTD